ncbi:HlyD family secretion protein [Synechococcus sp. CBW1107]|uniref:HlyD family secretion protein n=1 Tax=Synechococcus sp. CBW1107 TaxID=2789857 RepID=UPI002AD286CF|nr:HlyD family secretion protein [Synechococcus sp. CBW1107]CAK6692851.1 Multidrug resistance protein MdtN [Synechococcus sp. CBW1107]
MKMNPKLRRHLPTTIVVVVALGLLGVKTWDYIRNPWTRDGQVRATVIQVTSRISGPIIRLPIKDNQPVKKGELLFEIDPSTFEASVAQAKADLENTRDQVSALAKEVEAARANVKQARSVISKEKAVLTGLNAQLIDSKANFDRAAQLIKAGAITRQQYDDQTASYATAQSSIAEAEAAILQAEAALLQSEASLQQAIAKLGAPGDQNAQVRAAKSALRNAELNLEFSTVRAPVDGLVTNLNLQRGSQAVANQPALALVDRNSFRIDAYFRETWIGRIQPGDQATVTLMSYPQQPLVGKVESIGWGIAQDNGSTGEFLLPTVNPTFEWIRLAQRIPVRIEVEDLPPQVILRLGSTASVLVKTGTHRGPSDSPTP